MQLTNSVFESIEKYFNSISKTGYKSYTEVYKLLTFIFIEEILNGSMCKYITEEDYKILSNKLECLYGTCMIPYPKYKESATLSMNNFYNSFRVTEDKLRFIENLIRVT